MTTDLRQRFAFNDLGIRGVIVSLDAGWQALLSRRAYAPKAQQLLGELCAVANLMGSTIKFDGRLTLQVQSDAALKLGVVQYHSNATYRGMMTLDSAEDLPLNLLAKEGRLVISIQTQKGNKLSDPYQGVVPIVDETLAQAVETYFSQSEQLTTHVKLFANPTRAFGVLLQALPDSTATEDDWQRLRLLLDTLTQAEMQSDTPEQVIKKLFVEDDVTLYESQDLGFSCRCSEENTLAMLGTLDVESLQDIIDNEGKAAVECDFCGKVFEHQRDTLQALIRDKARPN